MLNGRVGLRDFWIALTVLAIIWGIWPYLLPYIAYIIIRLLPDFLMWPLLSFVDYLTICKPLILTFLAVRLLVRRLHDRGQSGWEGLLVIPLINALLQKGKMESNKFGPPLKYQPLWATLFD
jgi:uncharacterized membrane protein YhaH (DUF805 family)